MQQSVQGSLTAFKHGSALDVSYQFNCKISGTGRTGKS